MAELSLSISDLHAFYGDSHVLHGVTLDVPTGEVVTIVGRNGAGKTTTLRSIMGMIEKRTGSITIGGKNVIASPPEKIARLGVAYVPEERGIYATLDVTENLLLPRKVNDKGMSIEEIYKLFPNLEMRKKSQGTKLSGGYNLGFMFLPKYRAWVVLVSVVFCLGTWFVIEKTSVGRNLRAATENPMLTRAFGINVPALLTFGFGVGVALAGLAGVLAGPIQSVSPIMGGDLVIVVFAIVVVGGMQSILGAIITGLSLGVLEGLAKVFYAQGANMVIFVIMFIVLLVKPAGLFGQEK